MQNGSKSSLTYGVSAAIIAAFCVAHARARHGFGPRPSVVSCRDPVTLKLASEPAFVVFLAS